MRLFSFFIPLSSRLAPFLPRTLFSPADARPLFSARPFRSTSRRGRTHFAGQNKWPGLAARGSLIVTGHLRASRGFRACPGGMIHVSGCADKTAIFISVAAGKRGCNDVLRWYKKAWIRTGMYIHTWNSWGVPRRTNAVTNRFSYSIETLATYIHTNMLRMCYNERIVRQEQ